jgi:hypothetical protein
VGREHGPGDGEDGALDVAPRARRAADGAAAHLRERHLLRHAAVELAGWLLTGTVVARVMLAFAPPTMWARFVAPTRFPLVLYAVNGVLPIVICFKYGMVWAAWLGLLAMGLPLALALAKGAPAEASIDRSAARRAAAAA